VPAGLKCMAAPESAPGEKQGKSLQLLPARNKLDEIKVGRNPKYDFLEFVVVGRQCRLRHSDERGCHAGHEQFELLPDRCR